MLNTYNIRVHVERISNGFNVKINASDNDGMDKFYPTKDDMVADLKTKFEDKINYLEGQYQDKLTHLLQPENLKVSLHSNDGYGLKWELAVEDINPTDYVVEYNINGGSWLSDGVINSKSGWDNARRQKSCQYTLPSGLQSGDTATFRIKGQKNGYPDSQWSQQKSLTI